MIVRHGRPLLSDKDRAQTLALPIDHFLRSLAQDAADRAAAVILSGTGSDGSRGVRDVHEAGGLVVVQDPATAKFDGLPAPPSTPAPSTSPCRRRTPRPSSSTTPDRRTPRPRPAWTGFSATSATPTASTSIPFLRVGHNWGTTGAALARASRGRA